VLLGKMFAVGIKIFCHIHKVVGTSIDFIGTHAPTLLKQYRYVGTETANNHPLAWTSFVRAEIGLTVVSGFSIVENGSVTPHVSPVAFVDKVLLRHRNKFRACLNINDLVNISFIPPFTDTSSRATVARDCGPGSLLIDYAMRYCTSNGQTQDHNGTYAANGTVNENIVTRFLDTKDYLRVAPPLHIAREMFGDHEAQRLVDECLFSNMQEADIVATITRITAQNILKQYRRLLELNFPAGQEVDEMFVCGPSAENSNIVDFLEAELPENVITRPLGDIGIPGDANQAVCYAHLALEVVLGEASVALDPALRTEEAALEDAVRGRIVRGERWEQVVERIQQFGGGEQLGISKDVRVGSLAAEFNGLDLR
jgi:1,6-anhydro-N-acetylmuramate kinase